VKREETISARLSSFLNLYGFSRNSTVALALSGITLFIGGPSNTSTRSLAGLLVFLGIVLFYRYLKFYRLYSVEVFTSYAEAASTRADG
jgi:hypothetical protein